MHDFRPEQRTESIADGAVRSLDPAHVRAETIASWLVTACISGGGLAAMAIAGLVTVLAGPGGWPIWLTAALAAAWCLVTALLVTTTIWWPRVNHRHTSYVVSPLGLEIRRGVMWRSIVSVPRSRVQHADVMQGPLMRRFGLATITVYTAGTEHAAVSLAGLAHGTALRVRDELVRGGADDGV